MLLPRRQVRDLVDVHIAVHALRNLGSLALVFLLPSCASPYVRLEDRPEACRIAVVEKFDHLAFQPNSMSGGGGTFVGAGKGFWAGLQTGNGAIFIAPIAALIGAGYGTACAMAGAQHPNASADFERLLREADSGSLRRALEARMTAPRPECVGSTTPGEPDARIEIEKVEFQMSCAMGNQEYQAVSEWRTVTRTGRVLNHSKSLMRHDSGRSVDDWFAHPAEARSDIEASMAGLGELMAMQFVGSTTWAKE